MNERQLKKLPLHRKVAVGHRLYFKRTDRAAGQWTFRYTRLNQTREMGLGPYPRISLKKAFELRDSYNAQLDNHEDPYEKRRATKLINTSREGVRFSTIAEEFIKKRESGWSNKKHIQQWRNSLLMYASPILDQKAFHRLTNEDVYDVLQPIWVTRHETARRIQQRLRKIFGYAKALKWYNNDNPALWDDNLEHLLVASSKVRRVNHFPALEWKALPKFYNELLSIETISSVTLQFLILTAARTNEVLGCVRKEIHIDKQIWSIPGKRMKARYDHQIPLSNQATSLIELAMRKHNQQLIFQNPQTGGPLSNNAMRSLLIKRFPEHRITTHGFRSTFRDWAADQGKYDFTTAEKALAHRFRNATTGAYLRSDLIDNRRDLMQDWSDYAHSERINEKNKRRIKLLPNR